MEKENTIYKKFASTNSTSFEELKISVKYELGGFCYFDYKNHDRGIYVHFKPVTRTDTGEMSMLLSSTISSGFKMCVLKLKRKSQKQLDDVFAKIEPVSEHLTALFESGNFEDLANYTKSLVA